jgi:outer membrane autotransporter protein
MKHAITGIGALGAIIAWAPVARAADNNDWYVSAFGGGMLLEDSQNSGNNNPLSFDSSYKSGLARTGLAYRAAVGAYRAPQVRTELEFSYRTIGFDKISFANDGGLAAAAGQSSLNGVSAAANGRFTAMSAMLNAYYDYDTGTPWKPYIDAGIGTSRLAARGVTANAVAVVDAFDVVFAYQFGIGIGFDVTQAFTIAADYRYFTTLDPTFKDAVGASFNSEFTSHAVSLGVRYRF